MPRGVPKAGFRQTRKRMAKLGSPMSIIADNAPAMMLPVEVETTESDEEILTRLNDRFEILEELTQCAINGDAKGVVVSGPPGLGKSWTVTQKIEELPEDRFEMVSGKVKTTGLYKLLHRHRHPGHVLVFDDSDTIFTDEDSLNMLKRVCDTTKKRTVSYLSEYTIVDEVTAQNVPHTFEFEGAIIFITNYDFDDLIARGHKLAPHLEAMVSRSHYIDLSMKTRRDYMLRIQQVIGEGMLKENGLKANEEKDVIEFIREYQDNLRELSLRIALKIGMLRRTKKNWSKIAKVTCCRGIS